MKVLTGLVSALLVSPSALMVMPAAHADPYPHTVDTTCHARLQDSTITRRIKPQVAFRITTQGNATPNARVGIRISRDSNERTVLRTSRYYSGGTENWAFPRLKAGRYTIVFRAQTAARSVYKNCSDASFLRVTR
ncbi:hypothetical protein [Nocardioides sp.]|uniref:hypothetical protein n=1 Tax=Nocardioides sp. TaxID=35761 RepID=UPI003D0E74A7